MSEPIKVGDLVYVARDCCGTNLGDMFIVEEIYGPRRWVCTACRVEGDAMLAYRVGARHGLLCNAPLPWLKRVPPLSELDDVKQDEEITA